jgi:hypothetical protein
VGTVERVHIKRKLPGERVCTEKAFLDITKDFSLLIHTICSPFYWQIFRKTILESSLVLKIPPKNPQNKKIQFYS